MELTRDNGATGNLHRQKTRETAMSLDREYIQRPPKPIRLKPSIAREKPSPVTRLVPGADELPPTQEAARPPKGSDRSRASPQWTVRGVAPETRELAVAAAKRAGRPLGEWLDEAIRRNAAEPSPRSSEEGVEAPGMERVLARLDEMQQQLRALETRRSWWQRLFD